MSPHEPSPAEDEFAELLAACDEALLGGPPPAADGLVAPPDLQARLDRDLACLRLLRGVLHSDLADDLSPEPAPVSEGPGARLGRFRILRELGRGSYGIVFLAHDPSLGREVALKVPRPEGLLNPDLRDRFVREARAAASLDHPNLVPVFEAGAAGAVCYIASAYCPGPTLADWLRRQTAPVPDRSAAQLVATLAEAIAYAHGRGVIHRDLKPANILLGNREQLIGNREQGTGNREEAPSSLFPVPCSLFPVITDFGLAKLLEDPDGAQTASVAVLGTPEYMAPEQAAGGSRDVGPAADVYALGAILYELLTDRPPFRAETPLDTLRQVADADPIAPRRLRPRCPRDLETVCLKCLEKDPRKRYPSALGLAEDLHRFLEGKPLHARPPGPARRAVKWARRRPALAALMIVCTLGAAGLLAGGLWYNAELQAERDHAFAQERRATRREAEARELSAVAQKQRGLLAQRELTARRHLHAALLSLAQQAWQAGQIDRLLDLLDAQRPRDGEEDLRGFEWYYLHRLCDGARWSWQGWKTRDDGGVVRPLLALTPDGLTAATPDGKEVMIRDVPTGQVRAVLKGHWYKVHDVTFSAAGRLLASGAGDGTALVWDAETFQLRARCSWHLRGVHRVALSADGRWLATAGKTGLVKLWEAATGKERAAVRAGKAEILRVAFTPDGKALATVTRDARDTVTLWDVPAGKRRAALKGHRSDIVDLVFSPDGRLAVTHAADKTAKVWEMPAGKEVHTFSDTEGWVTCAAFSPDGKTLAVGVGHPFYFVKAGKVCLWDTVARVMRGAWEVADGGAWALAFAPDGRTLAVSDNGGAIRLHDLHAGRPLTTLLGHRMRVNGLAFGPAGRSLRSLSLIDSCVKIWNLKPRQQPTVAPGGGRPVVALAAAPRGWALASADADGFVRLRDPISGRTRAALPAGPVGECAVAYAADGQTVATGGACGTVKLWDPGTGRARAQFTAHRGAVHALCFLPDGRHLISAGSRTPGSPVPAEAALWDVATGERRAHWQGYPAALYALAVSPDGRLLACAGTRHLSVRDLRSGKEILRRDENDGFMAVAFSPDGGTLAAATWSSLVRLWDVATLAERPALKGHAAAVRALAFSPDGRTLASGSVDATVKLWDAVGGQERFTLRGTRAIVRGVAFRPDGRAVAAGLEDGSVEVWDGAEGRPDDAWRRRVAALPADQQVDAVARMLQQRNPGFDGRVTSRVAGGVVVALEFSSDEVTDLSPLRALAGLKALRCGGSARGKGQLGDLSPLQGLALTALFCANTPVADLSPLKGSPLRELSFDVTGPGGLAVVRSLKTLETINELPAATFWERQKAGPAAKRP